jgi:Na+-transporting methylmalonyl-CoA/oxaloacetate decarboxylase gamma subunit
MIYSLLHADLASAMRFNAVAVVALALLIVAYATWTYGRVVGRRISGWQHHRWAPPAAMVVVALWFIVRNLPFPPFTDLRV